jgi:hypothetical protein
VKTAAVVAAFATKERREISFFAGALSVAFEVAAFTFSLVRFGFRVISGFSKGNAAYYHANSVILGRSAKLSTRRWNTHDRGSLLLTEASV